MPYSFGFFFFLITASIASDSTTKLPRYPGCVNICVKCFHSDFDGYCDQNEECCKVGQEIEVLGKMNDTFAEMEPNSTLATPPPIESVKNVKSDLEIFKERQQSMQAECKHFCVRCLGARGGGFCGQNEKCCDPDEVEMEFEEIFMKGHNQTAIGFF